MQILRHVVVVVGRMQLVMEVDWRLGKPSCVRLRHLAEGRRVCRVHCENLLSSWHLNAGLHGMGEKAVLRKRRLTVGLGPRCATG